MIGKGYELRCPSSGYRAFSFKMASMIDKPYVLCGEVVILTISGSVEHSSHESRCIGSSIRRRSDQSGSPAREGR